MIKLYLLMVLVSGSSAVGDFGPFETRAECQTAASNIVDERMGTGRYSKIEAKCSPIGGAEI